MRNNPAFSPSPQVGEGALQNRLVCLTVPSAPRTILRKKNVGLTRFDQPRSPRPLTPDTSQAPRDRRRARCNNVTHLTELTLPVFKLSKTPARRPRPALLYIGHDLRHVKPRAFACVICRRASSPPPQTFETVNDRQPQKMSTGLKARSVIARPEGPGFAIPRSY